MIHRSLGADVLRTSECGNAASKRLPSRSLLAPLATDAPWRAAVDAFTERNPRRRDRIAAYETLLATGAHRELAAAVLAARHRPAPPVEGWLNKRDGRKKRIFRLEVADELLFRTVHRLVQPAAAAVASPWCHSFLPGGGARSTFHALLRDPHLDACAAFRCDVRDYFNSIDVDDLLASFPPELGDPALLALLDATLHDRRVQRAGMITDGGQKGVMAGTPLAPLLATLYLRDLDREIAVKSVAYARYSDDMLVLAPPDAIESIERFVRGALRARGLDLNESKSSTAAPGSPWEFLGFRYQSGSIDLASITEHKLRQRSSRLARALLRWRERTGASAERTLRAYFRRTNRRLYGADAERGHFSWATWFLPMLDTPVTLRRLDHHVQREARYAATGSRRPRARSTVPYAALVEAGHVPLVTSYWSRLEMRGDDRRERAAPVVVEA